MDPAPPASLSAQLKDSRLAHTKAVATGLLVFVAIMYVVATLLERRYPGFAWVAATCEAAMIGALADWFAVVALFRHPLGIPLPHTAIIPRNKARIAQGLGEFIQEQFLSTPALVARIKEFDPARHLSLWLLKPQNADFIAGYFARALSYGLGALDDSRVRQFLQRTLTERLLKIDLATLVAQVLDVLTENRRHHALLDQTLASLGEILSRDETRQFLRREISAQVPLLKWVNQVVPLDDKAAGKIIDMTLTRLTEVMEDPDHELRRRFDVLVAQFIERLKTDPATRTKVEQLRDDVLANPALAEYLGGLWNELRAWLDADLAQPQSEVRSQVASFARTLGARLDADPRMRDWMNEQILAAAPPFVQEHRESFGRFIERQVNEWQNVTLVRELERNIGPDLQFIRINGTLVGGAAGLIIYALTRAFGG